MTVEHDVLGDADARLARPLRQVHDLRDVLPGRRTSRRCSRARSTSGPQAERFRVADEPSADASLDYCSGCGICTQVCPQGVHIAEINTQARAKLQGERPASSCATGCSRGPTLLGRLGTPVAPLANWTLRNRPLRARSARSSSASTASAALPTLRRAHVPALGAQARVAAGRAARRLLPRLRRELLRAATWARRPSSCSSTTGCQVDVPHGQDCCGLPLQSNGMFDDARKYVQRLARRARAVRARGRRHRRHVDELHADAQARGARDPRARATTPTCASVSERVYDICEYLLTLHDRGELRDRLPAAADDGHLPRAVPAAGPRDRQAGARPDGAVPELRVVENDADVLRRRRDLRAQAREVRHRDGRRRAACSGRSPTRGPTSRCATPRPAAGTSSRPPACSRVHPIEMLHRAAGLAASWSGSSSSRTARRWPRAWSSSRARWAATTWRSRRRAGWPTRRARSAPTPALVHGGDRARGARADGVLVLMDLGSAVMSAEMAVEMIATDDGAGRCCARRRWWRAPSPPRPRARAGAALEEVAAEARGRRCGMKAAQLGVEDDGAAPRRPRRVARPTRAELRHRRCRNALGLHARPAARFVETARPLRRRACRSRDETTRPRPGRRAAASPPWSRSGARQGHELARRARRARRPPPRSPRCASWPPTTSATSTATAPAAAAAGRARRTARRPRAAGAAARAGRRRCAASPALAAASRIGPARAGSAARRAPEVADERPAGRPGDGAGAARRGARGGARRPRGRARRGSPSRRGEAEAEIFDAHAAAARRRRAARARRARRSTAGAQRGARPGTTPREAAAAAYRGARRRVPARARASTSRTSAGRVLRAPRRRDGAGRASPSRASLVARRPHARRRGGPRPRARRRGIAIARGGATVARRDPRPRARHPRGRRPRRGACSRSPRARRSCSTATPGTVEVDRRRRRARRARARAREAARAPPREARARAREPAHARATARRSRWPRTSAAPAEARRRRSSSAPTASGLLRTEFLFLDRDDRADRGRAARASTREIAAALDGRPLIVRTLDAGADKPLPLPAPGARGEPVPRRARHPARRSQQPELLRTQLRAIARRRRASTRSSVMFPMVATLDEFRAARALLERAPRRRRRRSRSAMMVEVPAAALAGRPRSRARSTSSRSAPTTSTQYTMAAERGNEALAPLLDGAAARRCSRLIARRRRGRRRARPLGRRLRRARRRPGGGRRCSRASACAS